MTSRSKEKRIATFAVLVLLAAPLLFGGEAGTVPRVPSSVSFMLQLGLLVFAAKVGGALFERIRLPVVLGELVAGVLIGPYLLGGIALPFFPHGLMADVGGLLSAGGPFNGLMTVTLVVLFFLIGLDTDLRQVRRYSVGGVTAGVCGFLFSFGVALSVLVFLSPTLAGASLGWLSPRALLVSAVVSVASVGVMSRMLAARGRLESPSGNVAFTAAMVDNVHGMLFFTLFAGVAQAVASGAESSLALLAQMALRTVLGIGGVALLGVMIARHVNGMAMREKNYAQAFVVSAACLLIASGMMGVCGLPVMSGAYVMGIAFSSTDFRHEIRERLDFVSMVLVPVCFALLGMQVNPNLLADSRLSLAVGTLTLAVIVSKMAGSSMAAAFAGLSGVGCLRVGVMLLPRGELTLALLATSAGMVALPSGVFFWVIVLVVISCVGMPSLMGWAFAFGGNGIRGRFTAAEPVRIVFQFQSQSAAMMMVNRVVEIFEDEGFYAQLLNRHEVLYRISRERLVIHLQSKEGAVAFECSERERSLVNTVMLELSSGVEQTLRELRKPLDDVALRKNMQHADLTAGGVASNLRHCLTRENCVPQLRAITQQGAISELVGQLASNGFVTDREQAIQAVCEREQSLPTGLEYGVALPHARTDAVKQLVCAVGLKREGLDFGAIDERPARIVVLVLAPEHATAPQLQLIAQVCRFLDANGRAALLACETSDDMYGVLMGGGGVAFRRVLISSQAGCLAWQSIALDLATADREQVLSLLLVLCARSGAVSSLDGARSDVRRVVDPFSERIGKGLAWMAVQTQNVDRMVSALGVCAQAEASADGVRVWVMVLYPASAAAACSDFKISVMRVVEEKGLDPLLQAKSSQEVLEVLTNR